MRIWTMNRSGLTPVSRKGKLPIPKRGSFGDQRVRRQTTEGKTDLGIQVFTLVNAICYTVSHDWRLIT